MPCLPKPSFIVFILDRVGRKKPLMFGAASFVVTFSILAAILANDPVGDPNSSATAQRYDMFLTLDVISLSITCITELASP
jgi:MFS family permease